MTQATHELKSSGSLSTLCIRNKACGFLQLFVLLMSIAKKSIDLQMIQSFNAFPCESQMQKGYVPHGGVCQH
jgi:hypothetical protein